MWYDTLLLAVNDPPSFKPGPSPITVEADSAPFDETWATDISAGAGEDGEPVFMSIECSDAPTTQRMFMAGQSITNDGVLSFTPRQYQSGSVNCSVTLRDMPGSPNGLSETHPLTIEVKKGELCGKLVQLHARWQAFADLQLQPRHTSSCSQATAILQCSQCLFHVQSNGLAAPAADLLDSTICHCPFSHTVHAC